MCIITGRIQVSHLATHPVPQHRGHTLRNACPVKRDGHPLAVRQCVNASCSLKHPFHFCKDQRTARVALDAPGRQHLALLPSLQPEARIGPCSHTQAMPQAILVPASEHIARFFALIPLPLPHTSDKMTLVHHLAVTNALPDSRAFPELILALIVVAGVPDVSANAMASTLEPVAKIAVAVRPHIEALPVRQIELIRPLIHGSVRPFVTALPVAHTVAHGTQIAVAILVGSLVPRRRLLRGRTLDAAHSGDAQGECEMPRPAPSPQAEMLHNGGLHFSPFTKKLDWLLIAVICLFIGAVSGFVAGLLGVGGGLIIVPALILVFDLFAYRAGLFPAEELATLVAVATSLACVTVTTGLAGAAQLRRGQVHMPAVRLWAPGLICGSLLSGFLASALPEAAIRVFIAVLVLLVAIILSTRWVPKPGRAFPGRVTSSAMGGFTGCVSGIAGIAGGNLMIPSFLYFNVPIHSAMGTASFLGPCVALFAALGYALRGWSETQADPLMLGYIHLPVFALISIACVVFAPMGVRFAHANSPELLRRLLLIFLTIASVRMGLSAFDVF